MHVVAISGAGSNSGKTTLVVALLRAFSGWGALKTSPREGGGRLHAGNRDYELVLDRERLMSPGSDTRSYLDAGASRAGWLIAPTPLDPAAVAAVAAIFASCAGLAVEGGSLAEALSPGRRYLVARAGVVSFKPSAAGAARRADALLVNVPAGTDRIEIEKTAEALAALGSAAPILPLDPADPADPGLGRVIAGIRAWARC